MINEIVKICGLDSCELLARLASCEGEGVTFEVEEDCLDAKITMTADGISKDAFDAVRCKVYNLFEDEVYSAKDASLQELVGRELKVSDRVLGVAESLTGGEVCSRIVEVDGISKHFYEGIVCYNSEAKISRLGVSRYAIENYGAVSRQTAYEMVLGITKAPVDIGVATTGLAGPTGDEGKPVGLVYIGVGAGDFIIVFEEHFTGNRNHIRRCATNMALFYLLRYLKGKIWNF